MHRLADKNEYEFMFNNCTISHPRAALFGVGSLATVIFIIAPQILLLFFMTDLIGVPAAWAGLAIALSKLCEVASDVLVGSWSDRQQPRLAARTRFMIWGALTFPLGFALIFMAPVAAGWQAALGWIVTASLFATIAYTTFSIPYITLVGELTGSTAMRLRLTAWRMAFVAIGVMVAGAGAPVLVDLAGGGVAGYRVMAASLTALMIAAALAAVVAVPRGETAHLPLGVQPNLADALNAAARAPAYRILWVSYVCQMAGISLNAALLPYAVYMTLRADTPTIAMIFAVMTVGTLLAMPLAVIAARGLGTVSACVASLLISGVGLVLLACGQGGLIWPTILGAAVFGVGQAGATSLPFALLPQALDHAPDDLACANAGALTGLWVAGEKLGLALGAATAGGLLGLAGYDSTAVVQPAAALAALPWLFGPLPALLMLAAALLLRPLLGSPLNSRAPA
jgi:glycoside/pentoside/hexuronide:cation symporter, GPH family